MSREWGINTIAVHAGREVNPTRAVAPPIFQTAVFELEDAAAGARFAQEIAPTEYYTRWGNPTTRQAETLIAALEGGERALALSSGMAAVATAVFACVTSGEHIVAGRSLYAATMELFRNMLPRLGIEVTFVPPTDPENFRRAIRPNTKLIYVETPSNPRLDVTDLSAVAHLAREHGIFTIADNTFATPYNQRPLQLGIDAVVHSATKYLGGHHDLTAGAIVGSAVFIERCWQHAKLFGPTLSPFEAWLLIRGMKTFGLRLERQNANAQRIAEFLETHPQIERVFYPGLPSHPQHDVARRQMRGFGGMVAFEVKGGREAGRRLVESVRVITLAVSLGGVTSLIQHPASMSHGPIPEEERRATGITESLIRLSVGIEDVEDLIADLDQALARLA
ncbi:MAG: aminotransferase class I/II-fold pyridoxal phosphate-dependent enzyme [Blastocatellia bacterium]|nr:aminotransferase class I/II-fold pyridoxal phosphate-dependent enzyme [Blastocatellia bacterium]